METLTLDLDEATVGRIDQFAESINISREEAAARLLRIASTVRESMRTSGLLEGGPTGEFVVSFEATPGGPRAVKFRRLDQSA
jgi:predicted transcriptional regulator